MKLRSSFRNCTAFLLTALKADEVYGRMRRVSGIPILAYHRIYPHNAENKLVRELIVDPDSFKRQANYLKSHYDVVSLEHAVSNMQKGFNTKKKVAVITFDDAYADNFEFAYPVLRQYRLPATIFVSTGFIGRSDGFWWDALASVLTTAKTGRAELEWRSGKFSFQVDKVDRRYLIFNKLCKIFKYVDPLEIESMLKYLEEKLYAKRKENISRCLTWNQMREMQMNGITFGAHGHTHRPFSRLSEDELVEELSRPRALMAKELGCKTAMLAYPYGESGDWNQTIKNVAVRHGYSCAVTMTQGFNDLNSDRFGLARIGIGGFDTDAIFRLKVSGLFFGLGRAEKRG